MFEKYLTWLKAHEKLLIVVLSAWLVFHFYNRVIDAWAQHDKIAVAVQQIQAQTAQQKVEQDTASNAVLLKELADLKLQLVTVQQQAQASIAKRQADTITQKQNNDKSTLPEVAQRLQQQLRLQSVDIQVDPVKDTLVFSSTASHQTVNAMEDLQQAKLDVLDLNKQYAACTAVNNKQNETITGLQGQLVDEKKSHVADLKLEQEKTQLAKDEGRRQFRRGFKWGAILGFIGGVVTLHKL